MAVCLANKNYAPESAASEFMSTVPDDLLLEILIRLPLLGPAMTVCKNWYSLIISDHPNAFHRHTLHHHRRQQAHNPDPLYTPPYTFLLESNTDKPCLQLLAEKSKILRSIWCKQFPNYKTFLGFVFNLKHEEIKAAFNDSLLIDLNGQYFICNLTTQEQRLLPDPRLTRSEFHPMKFALVGNGSRFRVLIFRCDPFRRLNNPVPLFSSETGEWSESALRNQPEHYWTQMVATDGALHWLERSGRVRVYDPFRQADDPNPSRIVDPPPQFLLSTDLYSIAQRLGAVRGRLRFAQMTVSEKKDAMPYLRIWELDSGEDRWSLVHAVNLRWKVRGEIVDVFAFHPGDGDVVFLSRGSAISRCKFKDGNVLEVPFGHSPRMLLSVFDDFLPILTLVHTWPAQIL